MEFKELLLIFRRDFRFFTNLTIGVFVLGMLAILVWPLSYRTVLSVNITREGKQVTADYKYDSFYRLQADERFADTVVRWMKSPRMAADILNEAGVSTIVLNQRQLSGFFKAERLSSQLIEIEFSTKETASAQKISGAVEKILNAQAGKLDLDQNEESWFKIIKDEPIIRLAKPDWPKLSAGLAMLAAFIGFWATLSRHYMSKTAYEDRG